jgi:hypothetical protein
MSFVLSPKRSKRGSSLRICPSLGHLPPPVNHVLVTVTTLLTTVPHSVTCGDSRLGRGTPFARALSEDGAGAVPAGGEYALRSRAVRASTPPAIGSAREVLRLSASHDAGNARIRWLA